MPSERRWNHRIDVSMSADMKKELDKLAKENATSLAQQVRVAINHYLILRKKGKTSR